MSRNKKEVATPVTFSRLGVNWDPLVLTTSTGALLLYSTLDKAMQDFESWCFKERTGVDMRISWTGKNEAKMMTIPWEKILTATGNSYSQINEDFWALIKEDIKEWHGSPKRAAAGNTSQNHPAFNDHAVEVMHKVFEEDAVKNEMKLDSLAYALWHDPQVKQAFKEAGKTSNDIATEIRTYARLHSTVFSITAGAGTKVIRLQKPGKTKGKMIQTGAAPAPARAERGSKAFKPIQKFTSRLEQQGFTKAMWKDAIKHYGREEITEPELNAYRMSRMRPISAAPKAIETVVVPDDEDEQDAS